MYVEFEWALKALVALEVLRPSWTLLHAAAQHDTAKGHRPPIDPPSVGSTRPDGIPSTSEPEELTPLARATSLGTSKYRS